MITKQMVNRYLDKDYHRWIANVITDICNDPSDISILKKQIKEDWDLRKLISLTPLNFVVVFVYLLFP